MGVGDFNLTIVQPGLAFDVARPERSGSIPDHDVWEECIGNIDVQLSLSRAPKIRGARALEFITRIGCARDPTIVHGVGNCRQRDFGQFSRSCADGRSL